MAVKPKPSIEDRAKEKICPNCGGPVERRSAKGAKPVFCGAKCAADFQARQRHEGRAAIALLKAWRIDRGSSPVAKEAFLNLCRMVDYFNFEDGKAGRPRPDLYCAKLMADGLMFFDRTRR